ncbi:hypothetical protein PENANT_c014G09160 [Penicillium antarcticum]|uniref:Uncharacterized protein n=1 Tax=Penicillium antarcticum TaxID=416450 RepID=A0A1V6Q461_9EURO|nr:hypothetical protein PENANT_c014G09160 [Penicillium antarcticum]
MAETECHPAKMQLLPNIIGGIITTPTSSDTKINPVGRWLIINKISEHTEPATPKDVADGLGPACPTIADN